MAKVADNVAEFVRKASELKGQMEAENFSYFMWSFLHEEKFESPIEQLFWVAIHLMSDSFFHEINPQGSVREDKTVAPGFGIHIAPQKQIGRFRADFLVWANLTADPTPQLVVELDGHDFHDRSKEQRSYEKSRDRFFVKNGYRVVHFTGSDVVRDPLFVAYEVLDAAGVKLWREYDKNNPMGLF